jgi:hypothetical protein
LVGITVRVFVPFLFAATCIGAFENNVSKFRFDLAKFSA